MFSEEAPANQIIKKQTVNHKAPKKLRIGDTVKVEIIKIGEKGIDLKLLEKMD